MPGDERADDRGPVASRRGRAVLVALGLVGALLVAEGALRAIGFRFQVGPETAEFAYPSPEQRAGYVADPDLFWTKRGYVDGLRRPRSPDRAVAAFLGDSCTIMSRWPERWGRLVQERHPGVRLDAEPWGEIGYTSWQGLQQLRRDVLPRRPQVVTLAYGWNDHWAAFGLDDRALSDLQLRGPRWLVDLRVVQLAVKARVAARVRWSGARPARVPVDDFRRNLADAVAAVRSAGAVPVLLALPSGHEVGHEPEALRERFLPALDQLVPLHRRYVDAVRDVAATTGATLCDVAARFDAVPWPERGALLQLDGIHFTDQGDDLVARTVSDCFEADERVVAGLGLARPTE